MHSASTLPPSFLPSFHSSQTPPHTAQFLVTEFYCVASSFGAIWVITGLGVSVKAGGPPQWGHSRGTDSPV